MRANGSRCFLAVQMWETVPTLASQIEKRLESSSSLVV